MKKLLVGLVAALAIASAAVPGVQAAMDGSRGENEAPFEGTFTGYVYGNRGSRAPLTLVLTQDGDEIEGTARLGKGLYVDAGWCGKGYIPAVEEAGQVEIARNDPRRFQMRPSFDVSGLKVTVDLEGTLSADGNTITAEAELDLPWICGRDPELTAELYRVPPVQTQTSSWRTFRN